MENPYKEPPKKCILCGITVNYKNVQVISFMFACAIWIFDRRQEKIRPKVIIGDEPH